MKSLMNVVVFLIVIELCLVSLSTQFYNSGLKTTSSIAVTNLYSLIPKDATLDASDIEILRVLGKIDLQADRNVKKMLEEVGDDDTLNKVNNGQSRVTSVRLFEAKIGNRKCYMKEYLPIGSSFGKKEISTTRKLSSKWNKQTIENNDNNDDDDDDELAEYINNNNKKNIISSNTPPFPLLLGSLTTDDRIENEEFRSNWKKKFPRTKPPSDGNLWLVYDWDNYAFKSLKRYCGAPQIVKALDYFNKDKRLLDRWKFICLIMQRILEALAFFHKNRCYVYSYINSDLIWLSTIDQMKSNELDVKITDLGLSQKFDTDEIDDPAFLYQCGLEDLYQMGFIFLELIVNSMTEDVVGAQVARLKLNKKDSGNKLVNDDVIVDGLNGMVDSINSVFLETKNIKPLVSREFQKIYEDLCDSDNVRLREFIMSNSYFKDAFSVLELNKGEGWKLIFFLLARGRLYNNKKSKPLSITASSLLRNWKL